jgi:biotin transport system substrate-specific component
MEHTANISSSVIERQSLTRQAVWIGSFTLATAIGAQIEIPHQPVPFTLQTFFVLLSGAMLGKRNGALSQILYLAFGALGVPVFSHWGFGMLRLMGPTGGYLLSFPVAAFIVGYLLHSRANLLWSFVAMSVGLLAVFTLGTLQLNFVYFHNWSDAFVNGFLIFSWWDVVKLAGAAMIYHQCARSGFLKNMS